MIRRERLVVDEEIVFGPEEFFFSMTDKRGVILGGNGVFVRVSGYGIEELVGRSHNIIRHPDMPRAVFRLLWQRIQGGRPISAYVKNRAKDGRYYWVVANVYPLGERYLSVRFRPMTEARRVVEGVYRKMLVAEEEGGMDSSTAVLMKSLVELGFRSYEDFEFSFLNKEWKSLDTVLGLKGMGGGDAWLERSWEVCKGYRALFERFEELVEQVERIRGQAVFLRELAREIQSHAVNSSIAATRLGSEGLAIAAVSRELGNCIREGESDLKLAEENALKGSSSIVEAGLALCHTRTLLQALPEFANEIAGRVSGWSVAYGSVENLKALLELLESFLDKLDHNLAELEVTLVKQEKILGQIRRLNETLGLIRVAGSTNLARMKQRGEFEAVFARLKEAVGVTSEKLEEYLRGIERAEAVVKDCRSVGRRCRTVALELADGLIKRAQEG